MPGEEDVHGREHRHQQADDPAGRPVPPGGPRGDRDQPQGAGDTEGQVAEYLWPDFEQVVGVLYELARGLYGSAEYPFPAFHVQSRALLESAIALPHQPYYETFYDKLAAMVRSIAANHALEDGNKRLAVTVLHSTLLVNGYTYLWSDDDAVELMLRCASGQTDYGWLSLFIEAWSAPGTRVALRADEIRDAIRFKRAEIEHRPSGFITGLVSDFLRSAASAHARGEVPEAAVRQYVDWLRTARAKFG